MTGRKECSESAFTALVRPPMTIVDQIRVSAAGQPAEATHVQEGQRVVVTLAREIELNEGQTLIVELN
jgi:hypothetical protein